MKQKNEFRPANLRTVLAVLLIIITLGGGALFYWGVTSVREYAVEVDQRGIDAEASGQQIQALQTLKSQLSQSNSLVAKAKKLFATPSNYQAQVLKDVRNYARVANLSIAHTNFSTPGEDGSYAITVTLSEPVTYTQLITFLHQIEGNIPKLQVSELSLKRVENGGANSVSVGDIKIDIAVR